MSAPNRCGVVAAYVHPDARFGALVELGCATRATSSLPEVRNVAHELAIQVAATGALVLHREDLSEELLKAACDRYTDEETRAGRRADTVRRRVAIRMEQYREQACLLEQRWLKDPALTIRDLLDEQSDRTGEHLEVVRFARFAVDERGPVG